MNTILKQMKTIPLLLLGLALSVSASAQQTLSLKDALTYAIQNNVNLRKAKLDIAGGRYKTEEIRSQALPQLTGNAGLTYNAIIGQQDRFRPLNSVRNGIQVPEYSYPSNFSTSKSSQDFKLQGQVKNITI
jgi:outer membrane protein TolC